MFEYQELSRRGSECLRKAYPLIKDYLILCSEGEFLSRMRNSAGSLADVWVMSFSLLKAIVLCEDFWSLAKRQITIFPDYSSSALIITIKHIVSELRATE